MESPDDQAANRLKTPRSDRSPCAHVSLGLRTVAVIEAAKETTVPLLAYGVVYLIQESDAARGWFRLSPIHEDGRLSILFTDLASHATYGSLRVLAVGALAYAAMRSAAAYGLWRGRQWAKNFEIWCTALYLPQELLYWLLRHPIWLRCGLLVANVVTLLFFLTLRVKEPSS